MLAEESVNILENTTAKVVFYSCISEPRTFSEIATIWEYQSPNYFYQKNQRMLLDRMVKAGLISSSLTQRGDIISNIDAVLDEKSIDEFFQEINVDLFYDVIENRYGDQFSRKLFNDNTFLNYLISKEEGLKDILIEMAYNKDGEIRALPL